MYYIVYGLLYLFSLLPLKMLFLFSDFAYFLLYRVFGYRTKVVRINLKIAFPEKSPAEIKRIEKDFYLNFTDNFIESIKLISGGVKFARKHFHYDGSLLQTQFQKGNKSQINLGHFFNWEVGNIATTDMSSYPMLMVYLPIKNKIFERLMYKIRSSTNNPLLSAANMKNEMIPYRNELYMLALIADQVPGDLSRAYWLNFFGRPAPFLRGPERGAVAGNLSVFFARIIKIKRGYYKFDYELCTEDPASLPKGAITKQYADYLERAIRENPSGWLWSHRRWKSIYNPKYEKMWITDQQPGPNEPLY
ncbi:MAG: lysophospholipid acyltransferase family protein [Flavitalea sp.]